MCQCLISFCYAACLTASLHRKARKEHHARHQRYRCDPRESPFRRAFGRRCTALIANLHAASYKAMQDAQTAQAPQPRASRASSRQPAGHVPAGIGRGCRTLLSAAGSGYTGICRPDARYGCQEGSRDGSAKTLRHLQCKDPAPYEPPAYVPAASAPEPHPVYDQPSPAVNPYRQPAPDTTATLPALDATASQPEPETAYHQASPPSV